MLQAANPGCLLEDFIRWYSPRDWITADNEEEGESGALGGEEEQPSGWDTGWGEGDDIMLEGDKQTRVSEHSLCDSALCCLSVCSMLRDI